MFTMKILPLGHRRCTPSCLALRMITFRNGALASDNSLACGNAPADTRGAPDWFLAGRKLCHLVSLVADISR
jgi:hypothetical protein